MRRDAALEVAPQLVLHETRQATTLFRSRQKGLEVLAHRAVQGCPLDATRQRQGGVGSTTRWMVVSTGEGHGSRRGASAAPRNMGHP